MAHYQGEEFTGRHADLRAFILEVSEQGGYVKMISSDTARIELLPAPEPPKVSKKKAPPPKEEEPETPKPWAFTTQVRDYERDL